MNNLIHLPVPVLTAIKLIKSVPSKIWKLYMQTTIDEE